MHYILYHIWTSTWYNSSLWTGLWEGCGSKNVAWHGRTQDLMEEVYLLSFSPLPFSSVHLLSLSSPFPPLSFPFPSPSLPLEVGPLKPAAIGSLGSAVSFPAGSGAQHWPKTNLVHYRAVRKSLVAIILSILKCIRFTVDRSKFSTN